MSILAVTRRGVAARSAFSLSTAIRCQSSNAPSQSSVEVAEKETKEITTPAPQKEAVAADVISGAPTELRHRTVRVYRPAKSTMQSGGMKSDKWRIDFDILPGGARWENPLMGWASSADYMQGTRMSFRTREDAVHFAEKQGWDYYVQQEPVKRIPPKNYSENFLYNPNKLRILKTK